MQEKGKRQGLNERDLKRTSPLKIDDLNIIAARLGLANRTEALEEAVTVLLLITKRKRRAFLLEEDDGSILRIRL